jgi:hypothetical protein
MGRLPAVTSSLSDRPGAEPDEPRRRRRRRAPFRSGRLEFEPPPLPIERHQAADAKIYREKKRHIEAGTVVAALVGLATVGLVGYLGYRATRVDLDVKGITDGEVVTTVEAATVEVQITFPSAELARQSTLRFDGQEVEKPTVTGKIMVWRPAALLPEGDHRLVLGVPRPVLDDAHFRWDFTVDGTPPTLEVPPAIDPVAIDAEADVRGTVERGATLTAGGDPVDVGDDGAFHLHFDRPPVGPVTLVATDAAGNTTTAPVVIPVTYPGVRGVHVTAAAWSNAQLRGGVLALVDQHRIDTVQLDLKDEGGVVGFDTTVPRAREIGAVTNFYDLDAAITTLHARGVRVVGRISAFRDPILARAAWAAGQGDQVIQTTDGDLYTVSGPYTNPANLAVRRYNLDIAVDAVSRGVDDILWDDARLPTGRLDQVVVPGLAGSPSDAVVGFLAESHGELRRRGAYQGVIVDGESATQGDTYGQDVARVARNADYVAPEIYPGYWTTPGRFGVADPPRQPGDLVRGVLAGYQQVTAGSGAVLVPWLQDFTINGVHYEEPEVRAQIDAARSLGVDRFLLWSPSITYTDSALDPTG